MPVVAESGSRTDSLRRRFGPGIYLHIPFCRSRCGYCDFFVVLGGDDARERFVHSLIAEIELAAREPDFLDSEFQTVFFGGGTPSLLSVEQMGRILDTLRNNFCLSPNAEVTAECNPESATEKKLQGYREAGIRRVSFGVQSMDEDRLQVLDRAHAVQDVERCVRSARKVGMDSVSLDLIYGLPLQNESPSGEQASWKRTLDRALELQPDHLSAYLLAMEPHVPLARRVQKGAAELPGDELCLSQYEWLLEKTAQSGFARYEISNFSRPEHESRHNQNYWLCGDYLGLGPSAHSHRDGLRWSNPRSLAGYEERVGAGMLPRTEPERLSGEERGEEWIFLGLRRTEGVPLDIFDEHWANGRERVLTALKTLEAHLELDQDRLRLRPGSLFVSNTVFAELALALADPIGENEPFERRS